MPRFVVLTHDHPTLHWDLMLEEDGVLKTWRLLSEPRMEHVIEAEPLADHRLHYLTYEGPVSRNRGTVSQWDTGTYQFVDHVKPDKGIELRGKKLVGHLQFTVTSHGQMRVQLTRNL